MAATLVLEGARSGKSALAREAAEAWAKARGQRPIFIATAEAGDAEMAARIRRHRSDRAAHWLTLETPLKLDGTLADLRESDVAVVPDNALAREFRDRAGWLHQRIAAVASDVVLVVAGLPLALKISDPEASPGRRM